MGRMMTMTMTMTMMMRMTMTMTTMMMKTVEMKRTYRFIAVFGLITSGFSRTDVDACVRIIDMVGSGSHWTHCHRAYYASVFFSLVLCFLTKDVSGDSQTIDLLLVEEVLHQLKGSLSHYLVIFLYLRWCRISSINSITPKVKSVLTCFRVCHAKWVNNHGWVRSGEKHPSNIPYRERKYIPPEKETRPPNYLWMEHVRFW